MLRPPLEESGSTNRSLRVRDRLGIGLVVALCSAGVAACGGGERQDEDEVEGEFPVQIVNAEFPSKQRLAQTSNLAITVANTGEETIPDLAITVFTTPTPGDEDEGQETSTDGTSTDGTATDGTSTDDEEAELEEALSEEAGTSTEGPQSGPGGVGPGAASAGSFSVLSTQQDLAIPARPVWILEQGYPREAGTPAGEPPPGELSGSGGADTAKTNTFAFGELEPNASKEIVWQVTPVQPGTYTVHYRVAAGLQGKAVAVTEDGSIPEGQFVVVISNIPPQTRVDDSGKVVPIKPGDIIGQAGTQEQKKELGTP
jgi:hypothetical protein